MGNFSPCLNGNILIIATKGTSQGTPHPLIFSRNFTGFPSNKGYISESLAWFSALFTTQLLITSHCSSTIPILFAISDHPVTICLSDLVYTSFVWFSRIQICWSSFKSRLKTNLFAVAFGTTGH